jgi:molybdopterin-guanine dinucleotide biosynthesis protein A
MSAVAGAVLAGGRSRRMGRDKALIELDGRPMVQIVLDALDRAGTAPRIVVGGDAARLSSLGVDVVRDAFPGEGPLGGVVTALEHFGSTADHVLIIACDLPEVGRGALGPLLDRVEPGGVDRTSDVLVARGDAVQPTCALWTTASAGRLRDAFEAGERSLLGALDGLRVEVVDVPSRSLRNINTPDQLDG